MPRGRLQSRSAGFTLVEVMVVVLIISVLASLAVPGIRLLKMRTKSAAIANDFRIFATAFTTYANEKGTYPPEAAPGVIPVGMEERLNSTAWQRPTPMGGRYDWENNQLHWGVRYKAAIAITGTASSLLPLDVNQLYDLDRKSDDGNLFNGQFRIGSSLNPLYIIEP